MAAISYSFCLSILHSFWQAGILLLCYYLFNHLFLKHSQPVQKRNFLLLLISFQFILFCITFCYTFSQYNIGLPDGNTNAVFFFKSSKIIESLTRYTFYFYILIVTYKCVRFIIAWKKITHSFYKDVEKPSLGYKLFCTEKALHLGIKKPVKIWLSKHITTPVTYGFFKPIILLPIALANQLSTTQVEAIILHELSHIKANDYILNWWLIIVENIFFVNPFVQIICSKIRLEREKACDIQVINFKYKPAVYAEALLQIQKQQALQFQLAATGAQNHLLNRILYFTKNNQHMNNSSLQNGLFKLAFCFTIFISLIALYNLNNAIIKEPPTYGVPGIAMHLFTNNDNILAENSYEFTRPINNNMAISKINEKKFIAKKDIPTKIKVKIKASVLPDKQDNDNSKIEIIPVAYNEEATEKKQIIIKEQLSGSAKIILKGYTAIKRNGEWVLTPSWIAATNLALDSSLPNQQ
jgi:beta-lactamase regulating signal transducer with metallopeptidase domain